jgi:hypothetical protein
VQLLTILKQMTQALWHKIGVSLLFVHSNLNNQALQHSHQGCQAGNQSNVQHRRMLLSLQCKSAAQ